MFVKCLALPKEQGRACARCQLEEPCPACQRGGEWLEFPSGRGGEVALESSSSVCNVKSTRGSAAATKGPVLRD